MLDGSGDHDGAAFLGKYLPSSMQSFITSRAEIPMLCVRSTSCSVDKRIGHALLTLVMSSAKGLCLALFFEDSVECNLGKLLSTFFQDSVVRIDVANHPKCGGGSVGEDA